MVQKQIQLPKPTGSYTVGVSTHFLQDTSRHLLIRVYYPSLEKHAEYPPYLADTIHLYKAKLAHTHSSQELAYLDDIKDWAAPDARIALEERPFPVLFFSPGFLMAAQLYSSLIEELASHGYVVVAINHTDACWPVMFPDGTSPEIAPQNAHVFSNTEKSCIQLFDETQETWVADVELVLAWLRNQPFTKNFDFDRMGIFGHSFGGSVATEVARRNTDFKATVSLDSILFGSNWDAPFETPSLFVIAETQLSHTVALNAGLTIEQCDSLLARHPKQVFDQLRGNSFYVTVKGTEHASFVDSQLVKSPLYKNKKNPAHGIIITRALLVDFFDYYLKNKKMAFLMSDSNDIIVTQR